MKSAMPILASPIVQNCESSIEVENHFFRHEFRNLVRLYRFENVPTLVREWRSVEGLEVSTLLADREFKFVFIGRGILPGLTNPRRVYAGIESGPELVEHFAKFERGNVKELPPVDWVKPDAPCPILIHAYANGVEAFFRSIIVPKLGEGFAVSLCAADTLPTALEFKERHNAEDYTSFG